MKNLETLKNIKGKYVLLRADFNVPIKSGKIEDTFRIEKTFPTINYLVKQGAKVIVVSHAGDDGKQTLKPVADYLKKFYKIRFSKEVLGNITTKERSLMENGSLLLLENIRRDAGEKENDSKFAKRLADLATVFVNDAFSVCHREHASIVGVPKILKSYAGIQLQKEIKHLDIVIKKPKHPFLFILGGAKFDTKLPLLKKFLKSADTILIGGALSNQVFKELGYETGVSLVEDKNFGLKKIIQDEKINLPLDIVAVSGKNKSVKNPINLSKKDNMLDVGPLTLEFLIKEIKKARLILWNGPLGKAPYLDGTIKTLRAIASSKAISIIGGGDTVEFISESNMEKKFTFVSTGGGATLEYLALGTLPGIKALK